LLAKLHEAQTRGYEGMRVSGDAFWIETSLWKEFTEYDAELDRAVLDREMIVLCTYSHSHAVNLADVARAHNFSMARRHGQWEYLENPELAQARRQIRRLNGAIDILSNRGPFHDVLTPRERVALAQIVRGASTKEAARNLGISPRTMEFHRANIMRKLKARNVAELIHKVLGGNER
jgi:DNA-binding CsgD family transcriptional regulator